MTSGRAMKRGALLAMVLCAGTTFGGGVEVWTRGEETAKTVVNLERLHQETRELFDPQYGRILLYRGTPLAELFEAAPARPGADLALLHFQNGMVVPIRFLDARELAKLDAFVARAWAPPTADGQARWSLHFPPLPKAGKEREDRRPLRFDGNKVVVRTGWHPAVPDEAAKGFSPWRFVDALVAVEYVKAAEHYAPFARAAVGAEAGYAIFQSRCQFCHGARGHGAAYGWDFVEPVALHAYRSPKFLELHVRYRELASPELGLMMPPFPELDRRRVDELWKWMEQLARGAGGGASAKDGPALP